MKCKTKFTVLPMLLTTLRDFRKTHIIFGGNVRSFHALAAVRIFARISVSKFTRKMILSY